MLPLSSLWEQEALHLGWSSAARQGPANLVQQTHGAHKMSLMSFCLLSSSTIQRIEWIWSRFKLFHLEQETSAVRNAYGIEDNPNHLQLMYCQKASSCFCLAKQKSRFSSILLKPPIIIKPRVQNPYNCGLFWSLACRWELWGNRESLKCTTAKGNKAAGGIGRGACCHENTVQGGEEMRKLPSFIRWNSRRVLCGYNKD